MVTSQPDGVGASPSGTVRASTGSVFQLPVIRTRGLEATIGEWQAAGVTVLAAVPRDGASIYDTDLSRPVAILMGGEGPGLPTDIIHANGNRMAVTVEPLAEAIARTSANGGGEPTAYRRL